MYALLAESVLLRPDVLLATALLVLVLLLGAIVLVYANRWKKSAILPEASKPMDELANYRAMFQRGELTAVEYEKVRLRISERMKNQLGIAPSIDPAPPAGPDGPAASPPSA